MSNQKESEVCNCSTNPNETRSLILKNIDELKGLSSEKIALLDAGYYKNVHIVGDEYFGVFELATSLMHRQPHVKTNDGKKTFTYKHDGQIIVDVFGVKRNSEVSIDSNARIIEELIEFAMPLKFLKGTYHIREIDLSKPSYRISTYIGVHNRDYFQDRLSWSKLETKGSSLFVHKDRPAIKTPIDFRNFYVQSQDYSGEFFDCPELMGEAGMSVENCRLEGFNSILDAKHFATGLRFQRVLINACRYGIKCHNAANLAKFNDVSFHDTAQCISVFGQKMEISNIQLEAVYRGPDWDTIDLYGIRTYMGKISNVYTETYPNKDEEIHSSIDKFTLLVRTYNASDEFLSVRNFSFPTAMPMSRCKHMRLEHAGIYNLTPTRFYEQAPSKIDYNGILFRDVLFNDRPLLNGEVAGDIDTYIDVVDAPAITPVAIDTYTNLLCEKKYNRADACIPSSLGTTGHKYYDEGLKMFYLNSNGKFQVTGKLSINNHMKSANKNEPENGKVILGARYNKLNSDGTHGASTYERVGVYEMIDGKLEGNFSFTINHVGQKTINLYLERKIKDGYVPVDMNLFEQTKFSYSIRQIESLKIK